MRKKAQKIKTMAGTEVRKLAREFRVRNAFHFAKRNVRFQRSISSPLASISSVSISVNQWLKLTFSCLLLFAMPVFAQQAEDPRSSGAGIIRGTVTDREDDTPLAAAQVLIAETGAKAMASEEGSFVFGQVTPGKYTLVFSKEGYTRQVTADVMVEPGRMTDANATMIGEYTEMDEFVVQKVETGGGSEEGLLNLRMESSALMDSVGTEAMSRAGAGDAAGALRMVPGATVQDGKYAVVRGLPDRYVVSQMNGVRLPSADPNKRAVQLDQFPSSLIESIQVSKTFTPDQQGDASGGAVNVMLKGVPDENVLKIKVGTKYNSNVNGKDFLTYRGGGVNFLGLDNGSRDPQTPGTTWKGAVGVSHGEAPPMYDWVLTAGGKHELDNGIKLGGGANVYYKQDAFSYKDGIDDKYDPNAGILNEDTKTSLFDVQKSTDKVQWGYLGVVGAETERNKFKLLNMRTHVAEDTAVLAEDTRGKALYFPGYDPYNPAHLGNSSDYRTSAPYRRFQTLEYTERDTGTLQLSGDHKIPFPEIGIPNVVTLLEPELDWTLSQNSSGLYSPDKRMFGEKWVPPNTLGGTGYYVPDKPTENINIGNVQRIWKDVQEDGSQRSLNGKLPFEQWSGDPGYFKLGMFNDTVDRKYTQDSFSANTGGAPVHFGNWEDPYYFPDENHVVTASDTDANYVGGQEINAVYYMVDLPLCSFFKVTGGTRYESTALDITLDPEGGVYWVPPSGVSTTLSPGDGDVKFQQDDVLPALGFEFTPQEALKFRASYSETVARQTFKELTPIQQMEYLGSDVFIGNPDLKMSAVKNYDLRADWTPYQGGLVSLSWFKKEVTDPIEYTQGYAQNIGGYIRPVNYPEGTLNGYEIEFRQQLDRLWDALEGLSLGANATFIQSEVTVSDEDQAKLAGLNTPMKTRDMLNAPAYLYNLNATYDIKKTGTQLGLFYTVQGDSLVAGPDTTRFVPEVYAKEFGTLNISLSQKIGEHWKLDFKANNLLNPEIQTVYRSNYLTGDVPKTSYTKGMEFSVSLGREF